MSRYEKYLLTRLTSVWRPALAVGLAVLAPVLPSAAATVRVDTEPNGLVVIKATDASVAEVLSALSAASNFHYQTSVDLNRTISGTYQGTLKQVLSRLLTGYNFISKVSDNSTDIVIVGSTGQMIGAGQPPASPPITSPASPSITSNAGAPNSLPVESFPTASDGNLVVLPPPSGPLPQQPADRSTNVASMLGAAIQVQAVGGTPSAVASPDSADMSALTQRAQAQLQDLVTSLQSSRPSK